MLTEQQINKLAETVRQAEDAHNKAHGKASVAHGRHQGKLLLEIRDGLKPGTWVSWLDDNAKLMGFAPSTARLYVALYRATKGDETGATWPKSIFGFHNATAKLTEDTAKVIVGEEKDRQVALAVAQYDAKTAKTPAEKDKAAAVLVEAEKKAREVSRAKRILSPKPKEAEQEPKPNQVEEVAKLREEVAKLQAEIVKVQAEKAEMAETLADLDDGEEIDLKGPVSSAKYFQRLKFATLQDFTVHPGSIVQITANGETHRFMVGKVPVVLAPVL